MGRTSNIPPYRVTYEMSDRYLPQAKVATMADGVSSDVCTIEAWSQEELIEELKMLGYIRDEDPNLHCFICGAECPVACTIIDGRRHCLNCSAEAVKGHEGV